ncbi:MAG: hypothetical protein O4861_23420 [Trichodesmium sp. St16_bin4-tuft]|nr:hypothetical protein [Trichodesmium sp. St4_bin8_1]MDE5072526.1 hypothetical protein [Trichodesmium sp. St5_bin8]MDE5076864.1 hypothetical protein [Trichodesmium sp. St2_bin6]MDE5092628.1 hypothetical protein [Trichodesmium sp. St18_bin3_1_1]MDE5101120.1 hypothetical protein [Trichodesmium sp. St16_bin4-tuft]MDE5104476.1 hypothetical protein [Trichodesmium sp. St19_bin2]
MQVPKYLGKIIFSKDEQGVRITLSERVENLHSQIWRSPSC